MLRQALLLMAMVGLCVMIKDGARKLSQSGMD